MYTLKIGGRAIEVSDWSQGIKRAREFHPDAEYAKTSLGDYRFSDLGRGAIGLPIWRSSVDVFEEVGRHRLSTLSLQRRVVGMVVRS